MKYLLLLVMCVACDPHPQRPSMVKEDEKVGEWLTRYVFVLHDDKRNVTCYVTDDPNSNHRAISCVKDNP